MRANVFRNVAIGLILLGVMGMVYPRQGKADEESKGMQRVVTCVTTDDVNRAAMAIEVTKAIMRERNVEGVLFFNVYGVNLVKARKLSPEYGDGRSIATMLAEFMAAGGKVLACPMCMKNVGNMTNADLLEGVVAVRGAGVRAISEPDTLVLSY